MDHSVNDNKGAFRVKDWWWSKAALLMGMIYLFALWFHISFEKFIPLSLLSLTTIAGFASMGYLFNDLFDIDKDRIAGKKNFVAGKSFAAILALFTISAIFVFGPWWFLPKNTFSYLLIGMQLGLFIIYSTPPFRLKERGLAGIVTDALYAHGLPPVLAAYTFALAANHRFNGYYILLLFAWQTMAGFRNIMLHQWEDLDADKKSGSKSFMAGIETTKFYRSIQGLIALELLLSLTFFALLSRDNPWFAICIATISLLSGAVFTLFRNQNISQFLKGEWKYFPNNIYEKWLPVVYLVLLSTGNLRFVILLILHLLLFNFDFYVQSADRVYGSWKSVAFVGMLINLRIWLSYPANYLIYYSLRLFGVDLKKENVSAVGYFRKRLGLKPLNRVPE